jgi:carboxymethylenebutenolidase
VTMEIQHLMWKLEELTAGFCEALYDKGDVDAALGFLTEDCALTNVPTGTGGTGTDALRRYLDDVVAHRPDDLAFRRLSKTVDQRRLADESMVTFTHDRELPWLLPGVAPTGRQVEVLAITVVSVRHRSRAGRTTTLIAGHRTLWDQVGLLNQLRVAA